MKMDVINNKMTRWLAVAYLVAMAVWGIVTEKGGDIFYTGMTNLNNSREEMYHGTYPQDVLYNNGGWFVLRLRDAEALTFAVIAAVLGVCLVLAMLLSYYATSKRRAIFAFSGVAMFALAHIPLLCGLPAYGTVGFNWNMLLYMATAIAAYPAMVTLLAMSKSFKPTSQMWLAGVLIIVATIVVYVVSRRPWWLEDNVLEVMANLWMLLSVFICGMIFWAYSNVFKKHVDDLMVVNWYGSLVWFSFIIVLFFDGMSLLTEFVSFFLDYFFVTIGMSILQAMLCAREERIAENAP